MNAAWFLRSRQLSWSIRYWIAITGYDIKDQSLSNRIYSFYLIVFFALWGLAVLALFSSAFARVIQFFGPMSPTLVSLRIAEIALFAWWLVKLAIAAFRCPVPFSPEDSHLICSTPTSRRSVVFSSFIGAWFKSGLQFWGLAILIGFSLADLSLGRAPAWKDAFLYLGSAFQFLLPVLLISSGMLALVWALGCLRLGRIRERRNLYLAPLALGLILTPGLFDTNSPANFFNLAASPFIYPLMAGIGLVNYGQGVCISLAWLALGALALYCTSKQINLSRAAQESITYSHEAGSPAISDSRIGKGGEHNLSIQKRGLPGQVERSVKETALVWKQLRSTRRSFDLGRLFEWFLIFGLSLGILIAPDWASRSVLVFFWITRVNQRITHDVRADLGIWPLYRSLPFKPVQRLFNEIAISTGIVTLLGWVSFLVKKIWGMELIPFQASILVPLFVLIIAASGAYDLLRQVRVEHLSSGNLPVPSIVSFLLPVLAFLAIVLIFTVVQSNLVAVIASIMVSLLVIAGTLSLYVRSYHNLGR